jgi:uncharacterized protein YjbJ (UPF0337 family)
LIAMTKHDQTSEQTAGGLLGKASGRAKELVGSVFGNPELDREGRLQQVQVEAEQEAIQRGEEADTKDAEAKLAIAKAETDTERRELEQEISQLGDEERIEREQAQEKRQAKAAHAEEVRAAGGLEREASRAERIADSADPEDGR